MRLLAVDGGVDVLAAGDHQTVQAVEHPVGGVGVDRLRGQQHRDTAGHGDALEIVGRQKAGQDIPDARLRLIQVGGQADYRSRSRGVQNHASSPNR